MRDGPCAKHPSQCSVGLAGCLLYGAFGVTTQNAAMEELKSGQGLGFLRFVSGTVGGISGNSTLPTRVARGKLIAVFSDIDLDLIEFIYH